MFAKNRNKTTLSWMEPDGTVLRGHTTLLLLEFKSPNTDGTGKRKRVGSKGKQPSDTQSTDTVSRTVKLAREQVAAAFVNLVAREQKQNPSSQQRQMQRQRQGQRRKQNVVRFPPPGTSQSGKRRPAAAVSPFSSRSKPRGSGSSSSSAKPRGSGSSSSQPGGSLSSGSATARSQPLADGGATHPRLRDQVPVRHVHHSLIGVADSSSTTGSAVDHFYIEILAAVLGRPNRQEQEEYAVSLHSLLESRLNPEESDDDNVERLAQLLFVLAEHITTFEEDRRVLFNIGARLSKTVGVHEVAEVDDNDKREHWRQPQDGQARKIVVKVYDYRDSTRPLLQRRRPYHNCRYLSAELVVDLQGSSLQVIRYRHLSGHTHPDKVCGRWFQNAAQQLAAVHNDRVIHGDVHLFNVLKLEGDAAQWIDFDYACTLEEQEKSESQRQYPQGFSQNAVLGRHLDAVGAAPICMEHDVHSFAAMLNHYQLVNRSDDELTKLWEDALEELKTCTSMDAVVKVLDVENLSGAEFELKYESSEAIKRLLNVVFERERKYCTESPEGSPQTPA